jgi:hypothetical protein
MCEPDNVGRPDHPHFEGITPKELRIPTGAINAERLVAAGEINDRVALPGKR